MADEIAQVRSNLTSGGWGEMPRIKGISPLYRLLAVWP